VITEHRTFCRICPVLCGLVVRTDGPLVLEARGDRDHPVTLGYSCPKGRALPEFHHHPQRLNYPVIRDGASRSEGRSGRQVSWPEMIDDLASNLTRIIDESGPDAVAAYNGTWSWMDALGRTRADQFMRHIGSRSRYSATTVDAIARLVVAEMMSGNATLMPMIDTDDAGLTVLIGTNPVVSHGHAGALVDPIVSLRRIAREHGLWVVDPRRSETARLATRHLAIRAGADPALLAYVVRSLLEDGVDDDYAARHIDGLDSLRAAVEPWTGARAAARTGLAIEDLDALVGAIRRARTVTVVTGTGCTMAAEANITEWLAWAIQIITGSFERAGGAWFNPGAFTRLDLRASRPEGRSGPASRSDKGRSGPASPAAARESDAGPLSRPDLPARYGERPSAALADEIESGRVRALLVIGGNPITSLPDAQRLAAAFSQLDVLAVTDIIESETVALATHVLPVAGQLEREDVSWFIDRFPSVVSAQRTAAVVEPSFERRPVFDILQDVGERFGLARMENPMERYERRIPSLSQPGVFVADPPRSKGWVHAHILPNGRWQVAPPPLVDQFARWATAEPLTLVGIPRRTMRRMNSALRDVGRGAADAEVWINPTDAGAMADGSAVVVTTTTGSIRATARITDDIAPGSVSIPHGLRDQNVSVLTTGAIGTTDSLSGMVTQSGFAVEIRSADTSAAQINQGE
jgi:anaerobic selenocysteine-containing dehydrogenase